MPTGCYVRTPGHKKVIELFGRRWHTEKVGWKQTELGRIMAYKPYGFDCLVVWEDELKDIETLTQRLGNFGKGPAQGKGQKSKRAKEVKWPS